MNQNGHPVGADAEPDPRDVARLMKGVAVDAATGCWIWTRRKDKDGYGQIWVKGKVLWVHRYSYSVFRRPLINTLTVQHKCRATSCCNPWHLELMTHLENTVDGNENRRGEVIPF